MSLNNRPVLDIIRMPDLHPSQNPTLFLSRFYSVVVSLCCTSDGWFISHIYYTSVLQNIKGKNFSGL